MGSPTHKKLRINTHRNGVLLPTRSASVKPQNRIVKLLIVEENGAMCRLVRALIEGLPVAVSECIDGAQALAACAEALPDWVLIDLTLAGADALAVTRQIATLYPHLRILLLTEEDDPRLREVAAKAEDPELGMEESAERKISDDQNTDLPADGHGRQSSSRDGSCAGPDNSGLGGTRLWRQRHRASTGPCPPARIRPGPEYNGTVTAWGDNSSGQTTVPAG